MVTHDYERGVISGLPKSVLDHVRRTGQLPDDAMSVNLRAVWEGLLWQKSHAAEPPGMTVAEILRVRDGWDDAFDPEAWERMTGGKVPFAPALDGMAPGPGEARSVVDETAGKPAPVLATDCSCGPSVSDGHPVGSTCGDAQSGRVIAVTEYGAGPGASLCKGGYSCLGGSICECYKKGTQIDVGAGAGDDVCGSKHKGMGLDTDARCWYEEAKAGCVCEVQCGDGTWQKTRAAAAGLVVPACPLGEWENREVELYKMPCERKPGLPEGALPGDLDPDCVTDPVSKMYLFEAYYYDVRMTFRRMNARSFWVDFVGDSAVTGARCRLSFKYEDCVCVTGPVAVPALATVSDYVVNPIERDDCRTIPRALSSCGA